MGDTVIVSKGAATRARFPDIVTTRKNRVPDVPFVTGRTDTRAGIPNKLFGNGLTFEHLTGTAQRRWEC
jgi:hypothetical protein